MSSSCPHCQLEDAHATADATCPRCGSPLDLSLAVADEVTQPSDSAVLVIEALPSEIAAQEASASEAKLPRPGLFEAIVLAWLTYIVVMVIVPPLGRLLSVFAPELVLTNEHLLLLAAMVSSGVMGWCGWIYLSPQAMQRMALFKPRLLHVLIALVLPLLLQIVVLKAESLVTSGSGSGQSQTSSEVSDHWYSYYVIAEQPWPLMLLVGCVLPAFCEEIFFRGCIGRGLVARYGVLLGVLLTSVLFGVLHIEPRHIAIAFCLGLIAHIVYLCSHSLWTAILLHFANNALAFGMFRMQLDGAFSQGLSISWPLAISALLGLMGLLWVLWRTRRGWVLGQTSPEARSYFSLERPADDARLVGLPWQWGDFAVLTVCLVMFGSVAYSVGKEGQGWYATRECIAQADAAIIREDYAQARSSYDAALRVSPNHVLSLHGRATTSLMLGDHSAALADADRCLQLSSTNAYAIATRAGALLGLGRSDEALVDARRAVELDSRDEWCIRILLDVALEVRDYPLAIDTAWRGALRADDTYYEAMLAWIYLHCEDAAYRDPPLGHDYARRVAKDKNFQDRAALLELAFASRAIGDFGEAVRWYEAAAALSNEDERSIYQEEAEHFAANGQTILKLRRVWHTSWVDDVIPYRCCKKLFVVTPKSNVPELQKEILGLSGYENWTCEIVADDELYRRLTVLAVQLATTPGIDAKLAEKIAWSVGPTLEDIMNSDVELFGKELKLEVAEAASLLQAIRQHHAESAVNKTH